MNFKISELIKSETAKQYNINNMPDIVSLDCMLDLICDCLQPLRDKLKRPIIVTSGYRSLALNTKLKGANNSQHCKGQAADIHVKGMRVAELIDFIKKSGIEYDQLINEHDQWVHISYNKGKNRKKDFKLA